MYPTLFRIPYLDFPISTFGVMMAIAFLVGSWITAKRMREEGLDPGSRDDAADLRDARRNLRLEALLRDRRLAARGHSLLAALLRTRRHHLVRRADRGDADRCDRLPHPRLADQGRRGLHRGRGRGRSGARADRLLPGRRRLRPAELAAVGGRVSARARRRRSRPCTRRSSTKWPGCCRWRRCSGRAGARARSCLASISRRTASVGS